MNFEHKLSIPDSTIVSQLLAHPDDFIVFMNVLADHVAHDAKVPDNYKIARRIRSIANETEDALSRGRVAGLKTAIDDVLDGTIEERAQLPAVV